MARKKDPTTTKSEWLPIRVDAEIKDKIKTLSEATGRSFSWIARELIRQQLRTLEARKKGKKEWERTILFHTPA